jgi:hypothetical protein
MARLWLSVLATKAAVWGITPAEVAELKDLADDAEAALAKVQDKPSRSHNDSVACQAAFKALVAAMRFMKNNHFNSPPLTEVDLATLDLSHDGHATPVPKPENKVDIKVTPVSEHLLLTEFRIAGSILTDTRASDYGMRVYVAVEDPAAAPGAKGKYGLYLHSAPKDGDAFHWSFFTHRHSEVFDFEETDRAKKVWFIARLERQKGGQEGQGPWGNLAWGIIP